MMNFNGTDILRQVCATATVVRKNLHLALLLIALPAATISSPAQRHSADPLITITSPVYNAEVSPGKATATIHMRSDADRDTFSALLNGTDIHLLFSPVKGCARYTACDMTAYLPSDELVRGQNVLTAEVMGDGQSASAARVQFEYANEVTSFGPARHLVASVAINTMVQSGSDHPTDFSHYYLRLGPSSGFPQKDYNFESFGCSQSNYAIMVMVLDRGTLDPDITVGAGSSHVGRTCFIDNAGAFKTFIGKVAKDRLVIVSSLDGRVHGLDTTAIGGSKNPADLPNRTAYSIIGIKGAQPGTAAETSYDLTFTNYPKDRAPLVGNLVLDNRQRYSFVSSLYTELEVIPNSSTNTASAIIGDITCTGGIPQSAEGGFLLCSVDRVTGKVNSTHSYVTNQSNASASASEVVRMNAQMSSDSVSPGVMVILISIGQPFKSAEDPAITANLLGTVNSLGGSGYLLPQLALANSTGDFPIYTLISTGEADYQVTPDQVVERTTLFSKMGQTGYVQALLFRDHANRLTVESATDEIKVADKAPVKQANYQWEEVGFQQAQDWPAWTPAQQAAYLDLTSQANHYQTVKQNLGCPISPPIDCPEIRTYYAGGIGGGDSPAQNINYHTLTYRPNADYTEEDFEVVITQLSTEQGYLANVMTAYAKYAAITNDIKGSFQDQLSSVANNLESTLVERNANAAVTARNLNFLANFTPALNVVGGVTTSAAALTGAIRSLATFQYGPDDLPQAYTVSLGKLRDKTSTINLDMAASNNTLFTTIVNDWAKLQIIGGGIGAQQLPWYMSPDKQGSNLPSAAIPLMTLGAKRSFYSTLLPTLYSLDGLYGKSATKPNQIGGTERSAAGPVPIALCRAPYAGAPERAWVSFPNPFSPSVRDFYFLVYTKYDKYGIAGVPSIQFPTSGLIDDLFDAPGVSSTGNLTGGAGLLLGRFTSGQYKPLPVRTGYLGSPGCKPGNTGN